jgi:hypothetical protein
MKAKAKGLNRMEAAEFLRSLARDAGAPIDDLKQRREDLHLIADYIEEKNGLTWVRGGENTFHEQRQINEAASRIERRDRSNRVGDLLDLWARRFYEKWGRTNPDDEQKIRQHIAAALKRRRKTKREK